MSQNRFCGQPRSSIMPQQVFFCLVCMYIIVNIIIQYVCIMYVSMPCTVENQTLIFQLTRSYTVQFCWLNELLALCFSEPPRIKHFLHNQPLTDALQLLGIPAPKQAAGLTGLSEELPALVKGCSEFPEKMTAEPVRVKERDLVKPEDFTVLSGSDIDGECFSRTS